MKSKADKQKVKSSRREFMTFGFLDNNKNINGESGEKVKMLTPDGKLVELDIDVFNKAKKTKMEGNKALFEWMNKGKKL